MKKVRWIGKMNIMIDLETMGLSPNGIIATIGAVSFDDITVHKEFYEVVSIDSCYDLGLEFSSSTVQWWLGQSENARFELLQPSIDIYNALEKLKLFIIQYNEPFIWAKGVSFDLVILKTAYKLANMSIPWRYSNERDVRTIYDFGNPKKLDNLLAHNALSDAKLQAENIIQIKNEMFI